MEMQNENMSEGCLVEFNELLHVTQNMARMAFHKFQL